jgi:dipeptidyl-peptidase-4
MADQPLVALSTLNKGRSEKERLKAFPEITWKNADMFHFRDHDHVYAYDIPKAALVKLYDLPADMEREDHDEAYQHFAYTKGENLYVTGGDMKPTAVTSDGTDGIVNGRSVHREEYGIMKGTFWSPSGDKLAFYRMDERAVSPYMLEDINSKPSTFRKIRYPVAGDTSHIVTVGVFDRASRKTVFLQATGAPDDYLTNISWDPTGKFVFVIHLNRATNHSRLVQYDAATGAAVKTLIEEDDPKWLEPLHPITFLKKSPTQYIYWSERDGWPHLYLYDLNKGLVRALTPGNWVVKDIIGTDDKETALYVEGTAIIDPKDPKGAMETHIYRIELKSGKVAKLTQEPGTHKGQVSSDGAFVIDQWSSLAVPGRTEVIDGLKGTVLKTLVNSTNPLDDLNVGTIEFVKVPGENGMVLNGRVIKPAGFDSRRQYPVLIYLYGGPHAQLVSNAFLGGAAHWM